MKKRIAKKIISTTAFYGNWDTDRQPYTIPQQRKAYKVLKASKYDLPVYNPTKSMSDV